MVHFGDKIREIIKQEGRPLSSDEIIKKWEELYPEDKRTFQAFYSEFSHSIKKNKLGKIKIGYTAYFALVTWMSTQEPNKLKDQFYFDRDTRKFKQRE